MAEDVSFGEEVRKAKAVEGAVGEVDGELSGVRVELESPSTFVGSVVVVGADGEQVVEVGWSVVFVPLGEVVYLGLVEAGFAASHSAGSVHRSQCGALG